jgi:pentapeptide repeat protein
VLALVTLAVVITGIIGLRYALEWPWTGGAVSARSRIDRKDRNGRVRKWRVIEAIVGLRNADLSGAKLSNADLSKDAVPVPNFTH